MKFGMAFGLNNPSFELMSLRGQQFCLKVWDKIFKKNIDRKEEELLAEKTKRIDEDYVREETLFREKLEVDMLKEQSIFQSITSTHDELAKLFKKAAKRNLSTINKISEDTEDNKAFKHKKIEFIKSEENTTLELQKKNNLKNKQALREIPMEMSNTTGIDTNLSEVSVETQKTLTLENYGTEASKLLQITEKGCPTNSTPLRLISHQQINKNKQGFYDLDLLSLNLQLPGELFDGEKLILSWSLIDGQDLNLNIICSERINLWSELKFRNIIIDGKGELILGTHINCTKSLIIKVQSLFFNQVSITAPVILLDSKMIEGRYYTLSSTKQLILSDNTNLADGSIVANNLTFKGQANLFNTKIHAHCLDIKTAKGIFKKLQIIAFRLNILGGNNPKSLCFRSSTLLANHFSSHDHFSLINSALNLNLRDDYNYVQTFGKGTIILSESRIISETPVLQEKGGLINLQNHSQLSASIIGSLSKLVSDCSVISSQKITQIKGTFTAKRSHLQLKDSFTAIESDVLLEKNSKCIAPTVNLLDDSKASLFEESLPHICKLNQSLLATKTLRIDDEFDVANQSQVSAENSITAGKASNVTLNNSKIQAASMHTDGQLSLSNAALCIEKKLILGSNSNTTLKPGSIVMSDHLAVLGQMHIMKNEPSGNELKNKPSNKQDNIASKEVPAQLKVKGKLLLTSKVKLQGNAPLIAEVNEFSNYGSVDLSSSFASKGKLFKNHGAFKADTVYLGYDDAVVNTGSMSASNLTIHSNFINPFGRVYVKDTLNCEGLFSANLGLICANNYNNCNLISANFGLTLPNFSTVFDNIFSVSNLLNAGKTVLTTVMPGYANITNLATIAPSLPSSIKALQELYRNTNWVDLKKMRRHEWMPYFGQLRSFATLGINAFSSSSSVVGEVNNFDSKDFFSSFSKPEWAGLLTKVGSNFVGPYKDTSLIHLNGGLNLSGNSNYSSLFHVNTGLETSLLQHTTESDWLYNKGVSIGTKNSFRASKIFNDGILNGLISFSVAADKLTNAKSGNIQGVNASIQINHFEEQGKTNINGGTLNIKHFNGEKTSSSSFKNTVLIGETFYDIGKLGLEKSVLRYSKSFEIDKSAQAHSKNVAIESANFINKGQWNYEGMLQVQAKKALLGKDGLIKGEQTPEAELFVEKEKTLDETKQTEKANATEATQNNEQLASNNTGKDAGKEENKKDFKPRHVFVLNTEKIDLDGQLSGGDYTQIQGLAKEDENGNRVVNKCDAINVNESAKVDLKYGSIASKALNVQGVAKLNNFNLDIDHTEVKPKVGDLQLTNTQFKGVSLISENQLGLDKTIIDMSGAVNLSKDAREQIKNSTIRAHSFVDDSQMGIEGRLGVFADSYKHHGEQKSSNADKEGKLEKSEFHLECKTAELIGKAALDKATYKIENFDDAEALLKGEGQYSSYQILEHLGVNTGRDINLSGSVNRQCGLLVQGKSVKADLDYSTNHALTFISTQGDVVLGGKLNGSNIYGHSAQAMYTSALVNASKVLHLKAEGKFENKGGILNGTEVSIKAASILNAPSNNTGGIISGRNNVFLEATVGNIENHGGMIRGGKYTQLISKQDVVNLCKIGSHSNGLDTVLDFDGGLIAGGTGENTNKVGLYVQAKGKVISDASNFVSDGINYLDADKGFSFGERQQAYISDSKTEKTWYGKKTKHVEITNQVKGSTVHSAKGVNILRTEQGEVVSIATRFSAPGGTQIYARDDVNLYSVKAKTWTEDSKSLLWGLNQKTRNEYHETAIPTLFIDNGVTRIMSKEGTIDARGALFLGGGDLEMKAKHRIKLGCDILDHEITEKKRELDVSLPGMQAYKTWKQGGSWLDIATAEDATLAKINNLARSKTPAEILASSVNLGIDLYNTSSSAMRGLADNNLTGEMLTRYGLGGADGFSPSLTLSLNESKTTSKLQTLGVGGIQRGGNVKLTAGDGVDLENGVKVRAGGDIDVDAPELIQKAAKLNNSVDQKTEKESVSINLLSGQIQDAAYSRSKTRAESVSHVNAELSAGGNLRLHHGDGAMNALVLDGGNVTAKTLDANINHLTIIDKQDTLTSKTSSVGASLNGNVSFYQGKTTSKLTNQPSGIHVEEGINNNGHSVHIGEAYTEGGKITTNGKNDLVIDNLKAVELHDQTLTEGLGVSINLNDVGRLTGDHQSTDTTGEKAIATGQLSFDYVNYEAERTSVIHGEQGSNVNIGTLEGNINTASVDGKTLIKNDEMHLVADIPLTNESYLKSASQNFKAGKLKLHQLVESVIPIEEEEEVLELTTLEMNEKVNAEFKEKASEKKEATGKDEADANDEEIKHKEQAEDEVLESSIPPIGGTFDEKAELKSKREPLSKDVQASENDLAGIVDKVKGKPNVKEKVKNVEALQNILNQEPTNDNATKLKKAIQQCIMVIMKEAANEGLNKSKELLVHEFAPHIQKIIGSALDGVNIQTKVYLGSKGLLISFAFNLGIVSLDSDIDRNDIIKEAAAQSVGDFALGVAIKTTTGALSSGITWGLVSLSVADKLLYDQSRVDNLVNEGLNNLKSSQNLFNQGHYGEGLLMQQIAANEMKQAAKSQILHEIATIDDKIASAVKWTWNKLPSFSDKIPTESKGSKAISELKTSYERQCVLNDLDLSNHASAKLESRLIQSEKEIKQKPAQSKDLFLALENLKKGPKRLNRHRFFSRDTSKYEQPEVGTRLARLGSK